jgi:hypothetical protein
MGLLLEDEIDAVDACALRRLGVRASLSFDHAEDVGLLEDEPVLAVDDHIGASPFAEQHAIADLDVKSGRLR